MGWIPTKEKLPECLGMYLVSLEYTQKDDSDFDYKFVSTDHYNGQGRWTNNNTKYRKVVAWMPLPDVYEEIER